MKDEKDIDVHPSSFMLHPSDVGVAHVHEWERALRLIFDGMPSCDLTEQVAHAIAMLQQGELDSDGVIVARRNGALVGAMLAMPTAGAASLVWPPRVLPPSDSRAVEDRLVAHASSWLRGRGVKLAQALLPLSDVDQAEPLLRNGYVHVTHLRYMRHDLSSGPKIDQRLNYQTYERCNRAEFHETLRRTYQDTQDCPEVNHVRDVDDVIAGHASQGKHEPGRWWIALKGDRPIGVLLLAELLDSTTWDLAYLGVLPEARRQGYGRELAAKAIEEARASNALELTLAVDARNEPALRLYRSLGFTETDRRNVYLAIWTSEAMNDEL